MAVYQYKGLGDGKLRNATRFEIIGGSPTLADSRDVLKHRYAATQFLIHSICGTHIGDPARGMLKQQPMLDNTHSNRYLVRAQVD